VIISPKEKLIEARKNGYAIGHFNVNNMEMIKAVTEAANEEKEFVIIAVTKNAIRYAGIDFLSTLVKTAEKNVSVNLSLHLDHGKSIATVKRAIECGFTSIMIDGSALPYEENVSITREVVKMAKEKNGICVEAELGHVGRIDTASDRGYLTNPELAKDFIEKTGVDTLAVSIGTIHGYVTDLALDFERLREISKRVENPLVLHGGTGVEDEDIKKLIDFGISKINIDTEIRLAFMQGLKQNIMETDPRKPLRAAMDEMKLVVKDKIQLFRGKKRREQIPRTWEGMVK